MTLSVFTGLMVGEEGRDEMQRAKGRVAGDVGWCLTCPK